MIAVGSGAALALAGLAMLASVAGFAAWRPAAPRMVRFTSAWLMAIAALGAFIVWVARWVEAGHMPIFGTFESALSIAAVSLVLAMLWDARRGHPRLASPVAGLVSAVVLAHGSRYGTTPYALTISERSLVVDIHGVLAWVAFAILATSVGAAIRVLTRRSGTEDAANRLLSFSLSAGFFFQSAMIATGSLYKFMLFGSVWSFDPIETMAFVVWVAYGTLLHMELMGGWSARRLAGWCVFTFLLLVVSYRGIVYFPSWTTYHIFDLDLRIHLTGKELLQ